MCRHLAYVGEPIRLAELLVTPDFGLVRQSWAPRLQRHGTVNADGFGVGWYADGDPVPARYRRAVPIWSDRTFADVARVTRSTAVLAAVRSATEGMSPEESAAAPFASGPWLFSHNGRVEGWPHSLETLAAGLPAARLLALESSVDSALMWALVIERLEQGEEPAAALAQVVERVSAVTAGRYNFLLTDGERIFATAAGDTLFCRAAPTGVVVASEPFDDQPDWQEVPENSVLMAEAGVIEIRPITAFRKETSSL